MVIKINCIFLSQSILGIGAIGGALIGGWAMDYFGRKTSIMLYTVPFATGWLLIANSKYGWMLFVGRLLTGIAVGCTSLTVPVSHISLALYSSTSLYALNTFKKIVAFYLLLYQVYI